MSKARGKALSGSAMLAVGQASLYVSSFARNSILARFLDVPSFGAAAMLTLLGILFEVASKSGLPQYVVRTESGKVQQILAEAHLLQFVMGIVGGGLFLLSLPIWGDWLGLLAHREYLPLLTLVPILKGIESLDGFRQQGEMRFWGSVRVDLVSGVVPTLLAAPIALVCPDIRAAIILIVMRSVLSCLGSHLVSETRYQWRYDREGCSSLLRYSVPLLGNSFLLLAITQAEQWLVGRYRGPSDLALYAGAFSLTLLPGQLVGNVCTSIGLPLLSGKSEGIRLDVPSRVWFGSVVALLAGSMCLGLGLWAGPLLRMAYGDKYWGGRGVVCLLAVSSALRLLRVPSTLEHLVGRASVQILRANLVRVAAVVLSFLVAVRGEGLLMIAGCTVVGESLAYLVSNRAAFFGDSSSERSRVLGYMVMVLVLGVGCLAVQGWIARSDWRAISLGSFSLVMFAGAMALVDWRVFGGMLKVLAGRFSRIAR